MRNTLSTGRSGEGVLERRSGTLHTFGQLLRHRPSDEVTDHVTCNDALDAPIRLLQGAQNQQSHQALQLWRGPVRKQSHVLLTLKQGTQVL